MFNNYGPISILRWLLINKFTIFNTQFLFSVLHTSMTIMHLLLLWTEAGKTVDMSDLKQIAEDDHHAIKNLDDIVEQWDARKNLFYIKTGISRNEVISSEDFDKELELMLFGAEGEGSEQWILASSSVKINWRQHFFIKIVLKHFFR